MIAVRSSSHSGLEEAVKKAFTMSQLYVKNRPPPIPLSDFEERRKKRDIAEICEAGRKRGGVEADIRANLAQLEALLPNLINLNRMKASDWALLAGNVPAVANKLILLKTLFPDVDIFKVVALRPRTLLQTEASIRENAQKVLAVLEGPCTPPPGAASSAPLPPLSASYPDPLEPARPPSAVLEEVPELLESGAIERALFALSRAFPGKPPLDCLRRDPRVLLHLGEATAELCEEYGEINPH